MGSAGSGLHYYRPLSSRILRPNSVTFQQNFEAEYYRQTANTCLIGEDVPQLKNDWPFLGTTDLDSRQRAATREHFRGTNSVFHLASTVKHVKCYSIC
jgi:hypothetical protein